MLCRSRLDNGDKNERLYEERVYPQMKRKMVSVMTRYLADNPVTLKTHRGDVRALAVLDGRIASVDDGQLIIQMPNTGDSGMGSEMDSDLHFEDSAASTKINFPDKSHPQCLSFSTLGSYVGVLDYTGKLSVFNAHSGSVATTYRVGKIASSMSLPFHIGELCGRS